MPRRAEVQVRPVEADAVYGSPLVTQVINKVMLDGKKSIAEQIVYGALETVGTKTGRPPVEVLEQAVKTVTPVLEVRSRRVGGANYQVPVEVPQRRARTLACAGSSRSPASGARRACRTSSPTRFSTR
jgi:small subunit ribosomal protein S7